ncbi:MAG TPA: hypothetical protein VNB06_07775 [Thermoanaerobaculia bacterium]|nr:hypothetical protein [Thermoanaerobaculia bacterium]
MVDEGEGSVAAQQRRYQAEVEDLLAALRSEEDRAIQQRLALLTAGPTEGIADNETDVPTEVARLRRRLEELAEFRAAVLRSRAWRTIQSVRRIFGRAW